MVKVHELPAIDQLLAQRVVGPGVAPNAAAATAWISPRGGWKCYAGAAPPKSESSQGISGGLDAVFDIASLTKPVTALTAQRLARIGQISLADPLERWVPQAAGRTAGRLSLETLLAHRSGLKPHVEFFAPLRRGESTTRAEILALAAASEREDGEGSARAVYSDLGYLLVGCALENASGMALDELMQREVASPLGLDLASARQWAGLDVGFLQRVAPTEDIEWRGGLIRGQVHDENAWALSGEGASGHAGLFGTVSGVIGLGIATLDALSGKLQDWLTGDELRQLTRSRPGGSLRAGFDGKADAGSSVGSRLGPETIGHLGFTGTSFWCDPEAQVVVALLTNRVCPSRDNPAMKELRPEIHDALADLARAG